MRITKRLRRRLNLILPAIILFIALLFQLTVRLEVVRLGYEVESMRLLALEKDNFLDRLKMDLAIVSRPERLSNVATKLELVSTERNRMRRIQIN